MPRLYHGILLSAGLIAATFVAGCSKPAAAPHKISRNRSDNVPRGRRVGQHLEGHRQSLPEAERAVALRKDMPGRRFALGIDGHAVQGNRQGTGRISVLRRIQGLAREGSR